MADEDPGRLSRDDNVILANEIAKSDVPSGFFGVTTPLIEKLAQLLGKSEADQKKRQDQVRRWIRNVHDNYRKGRLPDELTEVLSREKCEKILENLKNTENKRIAYSEDEMKTMVPIISANVDMYLNGSSDEMKAVFDTIIAKLVENGSFRTLKQMENYRNYVIGPFRILNTIGIVYMHDVSVDVMPEKLRENATTEERKRIREALWKHFGEGEKFSDFTAMLKTMAIKEEIKQEKEESESVGTFTGKKEPKKELEENE